MARPRPDEVGSSMVEREDADEQDNGNGDDDNGGDNGEDDNNDNNEQVSDTDDAVAEVNSTLTALRIMCKNKHSVGKAVAYLSKQIEGTSERARKEFCQEIVELHGLSILVFTLELCQARPSRKRVIPAAILGVLVEVTKHVSSCSILAELGLVPALLECGKRFRKDQAMTADILSILLNMNIDFSCDDVTGDDVIDYCQQVAQQEFPKKLPILSTCARIFVELTRIEAREYKNHLISKGVLTFLTDAFATFNGINDNDWNDSYDYDRDVCRQASERLMNFGEKKAKKAGKRKLHGNAGSKKKKS